MVRRELKRARRAIFWSADNLGIQHALSVRRQLCRCLMLRERGVFLRMRQVLDYCSGGVQREVSAGTLVIGEGGTSGYLYVLIEGRLEVLKGETVVDTIAEAGAILGELSVL